MPFWLFHLKTFENTQFLTERVVNRLIEQTKKTELTFIEKIEKINLFWSRYQNLVTDFDDIFVSKTNAGAQVINHSHS